MSNDEKAIRERLDCNSLPTGHHPEPCPCAWHVRDRLAREAIERLAGEVERLRERLAMATAFDAGGGVSIERCGSGWIAKRTVQPRGNRHLNEYLDRDGNWRRDEVTQFNTAEEVSAALDRARGGSR